MGPSGFPLRFDGPFGAPHSQAPLPRFISPSLEILGELCSPRVLWATLIVGDDLCGALVFSRKGHANEGQWQEEWHLGPCSPVFPCTGLGGRVSPAVSSHSPHD